MGVWPEGPDRDNFSKPGLTSTQANTLINKQFKTRNGLPFDIVIPNETTLKTSDETGSGKNPVVCKDADDMFRKPGN